MISEVESWEGLRWTESKNMGKSIKDIREELNNLKIEEVHQFVETYSGDERAGVTALVRKAQKTYNNYQSELKRTYELQFFERKYSDYHFICGVDEVGRGPLAGPVVAGAVILPKNCDILYINDSKKLSASKREELYQVIMEKAVCAKTALVSPETIDEINILQATYEAMRKAISSLEPAPDILLNDAVNIPGLSMKQVPIIKGDAKSISIGAASIVAKVTRDAMMAEYDKIYPEYDFASNKGYGSAKHIEALKKYGACPIHRKTFIKNLI